MGRRSVVAYEISVYASGVTLKYRSEVAGPTITLYAGSASTDGSQFLTRGLVRIDRHASIPIIIAIIVVRSGVTGFIRVSIVKAYVLNPAW
jgi:hypothetical protein